MNQGRNTMGSDKVKGAFAHNQRNRPPPKKGAAGEVKIES